MKSKIIVVVISLVLVIAAIVAVVFITGKEKDFSSEKVTSAAQFIANGGTFDPKDLSDNELDALKKQLLKEGKAFSVDENGNITVYQDYNIPEQGVWPDAEIVSMLPKPDFGKIGVVSLGDKSAGISITDITKENAHSYIEKLKEAGFTDVKKEVDNDSQTLYNAANASGYAAEINMLQNTCVISISKIG